MFRLLEPASLEVEIKHSRFIAICEPLAEPSKAAGRISALRHADATHNCWAYRAGDAYRFSDDGEPGGSAGRPILAAIDGQGYDGVLALVVRYFGGIKLGVGGLVRAYGNTVAECLRTARREEIVPRTELGFSVGFADTYAVYGQIARLDVQKVSESYTGSGVDFVISVEESRVADVRRTFDDATCGRAVWNDDV